MIRVSSVQYDLHTISSFEQFAAHVEHYVKTAKEFNSEFIVFPEFFTTQLLSIPNEEGTANAISALPSYTEAYISLFTELASTHSIHIIAGTHVINREGKLYNTAHLFYSDGTVATQDKLHMTPTEKEEWNITPGDDFQIFETEKAKVAMLTCYDIEFPEIVRIARERGADIIFCPSCTDDRQGFYRVRYCAHARAVENRIYVVVSGTVGALPTVDFVRANFSQAAIIAPNDVPFPPRGIINEGEINDGMIVTGDLDVSLLQQIRDKGSVTTWNDRRPDLYERLKG